MSGGPWFHPPLCKLKKNKKTLEYNSKIPHADKIHITSGLQIRGEYQKITRKKKCKLCADVTQFLTLVLIKGTVFIRGIYILKLHFSPAAIQRDTVVLFLSPLNNEYELEYYK
jgi:hypothetical protein